MVETTKSDSEETKRIHLLHDVTDHEAAYECQRCGHVTATKVEMKWHRDGIPLSSCDWARVKQWVQSLRLRIRGGDE